MPVCRVILRVLLNRWIKFPTDPQTIIRNKKLFWNKCGFPDVLGAIDCTHVAIIAPPAEHPVYPAAPFYDRKRFYSLYSLSSKFIWPVVAMVLVDPWLWRYFRRTSNTKCNYTHRQKKRNTN
jgi:hypothetical protein